MAAGTCRAAGGCCCVRKRNTFNSRFDRGVATVGDIPAGFAPPVWFFRSVSGSDAIALIPQGIVIALVGLIESISVAKAIAVKCAREHASVLARAMCEALRVSPRT